MNIYINACLDFWILLENLVTLRSYDTCEGLAEMRGPPSTGPELALAHTQSVHHLPPI